MNYKNRIQKLTKTKLENKFKVKINFNILTYFYKSGKPFFLNYESDKFIYQGQEDSRIKPFPKANVKINNDKLKKLQNGHGNSVS